MEDLKYKYANPEEPADGEGLGPVEMTSQEILMSNEVEEYSEAMKLDADKEMRDSMGKTSLAFLDLDTIGTTGSVAIFLGIVVIFAAIFRWFYVQLFTPVEDINETRKEMIRMRKMKKQQ